MATSIEQRELMLAKAGTISRIAVLQEGYWRHPGEDLRNTRHLNHEVAAPTLRSVLGLLHIPSDPQPNFAVHYKHGNGHEDLRGMHFSVEWSPNLGYERGWLEIFHDDGDPSVVSGVAISTLAGAEAAERNAIVKSMLVDPSNPFMQARILSDLTALFAEPIRS